jgi:hypothetical protein
MLNPPPTPMTVRSWSGSQGRERNMGPSGLIRPGGRNIQGQGKYPLRLGAHTGPPGSSLACGEYAGCGAVVCGQL